MRLWSLDWTVKRAGARVNLGHETEFKDTTKTCFRWLNYLQAVRKSWQKDFFFSKINVIDKPSILELFCEIMCYFRETLATSNGIYLFSCLRLEFSISNICVLSLINYRLLIMVIVIQELLLIYLSISDMYILSEYIFCISEYKLLLIYTYAYTCKYT